MARGRHGVSSMAVFDADSLVEVDKRANVNSIPRRIQHAFARGCIAPRQLRKCVGVVIYVLGSNNVSENS